MSAPKTRAWKILALGRGNKIATEAEAHLHKLGYPNVKVFGVENNQASDDHVVELLKGNNWDAISIGGGLNGYDDHIPREVTTLHWMNRLINLIHEHAPRAKFVFVVNPADLADGFERILGSAE